ncbi:glucose-6-phosphate isomerase, partial [Limosilactobacillus fermentum]
HTTGGVPVMTVNIAKEDEFTLGYLIYFFEVAIAISGYLNGINPFNQPGVEAYKTNMFGLLGKPGFEEIGEQLKKEIND